MARILFWNINNFSRNKIADPRAAHAALSADRETHIVDEVLRAAAGAGGLAALPDIFVIVEVYARTFELGFEGVPLSGNAEVGVTSLLATIRNNTLNNNWMVVPPLWSGELGFREGIAVFYNSNTVQFTGPYVHGYDYRTAGVGGGAWKPRSPPIERACALANTQRMAGQPPLPLPAAWNTGPTNYPAVWNGCLRNRAFPGGGGMPLEDQLAGQYEFYTAAGARIYFPHLTHRNPFYTRFWDGARWIKLFALHTSPGFANAAVAQLAQVREIAAGANEVVVVAADFNADTFTSRAAYDALVGAVGAAPPAGAFTMAFRPESAIGAAGAIAMGRRPYCQTHLLPVGTATPNGTLGGVAASPTHDVYPRFGYMGAMGGYKFWTPLNAGAIDNFLTRYGAGAAAPAANNAAIVNTVVGKPYTALAGAAVPAGVTAELMAGPTYASTVPAAQAIPLPNGRNSTAAAAAATTTAFQQWPAFKRIHSTSDHLAIVIDV